jgi:hypothetical protein
MAQERLHRPGVTRDAERHLNVESARLPHRRCPESSQRRNGFHGPGFIRHPDTISRFVGLDRSAPITANALVIDGAIGL